MYVCKGCGKPVEQAIEGELICEKCWTLSQMSDEEREANEEIEYMLTHCNETGCERKLVTQAQRDHLFCDKHWKELQEEISEVF